MNDQINRLEPHIHDQVTKAIAQNWQTIQALAHVPWYVYVTLDVSRDGMYDGDLHDYTWGLPVVSLHNVFVSPIYWRDGPSRVEFERAGLGIMYEHNFVTSRIPLASLAGT